MQTQIVAEFEVSSSRKKVRAIDAVFTYVSIGPDKRAQKVPPLKVHWHCLNDFITNWTLVSCIVGTNSCEQFQLQCYLLVQITNAEEQARYDAAQSRYESHKAQRKAELLAAKKA